MIGKVLLAVLSLPTPSVNVEPATEMDPVPDSVFAVGVNTTEYTVEDVDVSDPMEPSDTVISPAPKVDEASESVNVITTVWPDLREPDPARAMVTIGAFVS